jgi:hypothetical protein
MSAPCANGSVKAAYISFLSNVTAGQTMVIEYVESANPCHLGGEATCVAASLTQGQILAENWDFTVQADPDQTENAASLRVTTSARTMVANGHWRYRLRGPILTQIIAEDQSGNRIYDFGFTRRHYAFHSVNFSATATTIIANAVHWQSIPRPFLIQVQNEVISICYVSPEGNLTVGITNGTDASCANVAGRGQDGTTAATQNTASGRFLTLYSGIRTSTTIGLSTTSLTVNDASTINAPTVFQVGAGNRVRVCNKSGNTLTVGTGAWGCAASSDGVNWDGYHVSTSGALTRVTEDGADGTSQWVAATSDQQKPIHPIFVVSFYPGYGLQNVGGEAILVNAWLDRVQDQDLDLVFGTNEGVIASRPDSRITGNTMVKFPDGPTVWSYQGKLAERKMWVGTPPVGGLWDKNRSHLRAARVLPHDPSLEINQQRVTNMVNGWTNGNTQCVIEHRGLFNTGETAKRTYMGFMWRDFTLPGGRDDIGIITGWTLSGLQAMGTNWTGAERWMEWTLGSEACAGYLPVTLWDSATNKKYCDSGSSTVPSCESSTSLQAGSFGRALSIDAYPLLTAVNNGDTASYIVRAPITTRRLSIDYGHFVAVGWVGFMLTGDYYYQLALWGQAWGAFYFNTNGPTQSPSNTRLDYFRKRIGNFGIQGPMNGPRTAAWGNRTIGYAWLASPDGSPEQEYHRAKLLNNASYFEGKWRVTTGPRYVPCPDTDAFSKWASSPWCAGYRVSTDTSHLWARFEVQPQAATVDANVDATRVFSPIAGWQEDYVRVVWSYLRQAGLLEVDTLVKAFAPSHHQKATQSPWPFGTIEPYRQPFIPCLPIEDAPFAGGCAGQPYANDANFTGNWEMPNWEYYLLSVGPDPKTRTTSQNESDVVGGYFNIWLGALALIDENHPTYGSAERLIDWGRWGGRYSKTTTDPRMWHFSRPSETVVPIRVHKTGSGTATAYFTAPDGNACTYWTGTTLPTQSVTTGEATVAKGNRERMVSLTGLAPGTNYLRVTCGHARSTVKFTM